ncbi:MAG: hypothetical protein WD851_17475 [Pirellulales bacterium]
MANSRNFLANIQYRQAKRRSEAMCAQMKHRNQPKSRRANVGYQSTLQPFSPPEDWYETTENGSGYRIVVQHPGEGYRHIVTPQDIRDRLAKVPQHFLRDLEVVQLSQMTRKKQSFPCYGMQWGTTLYLYPLEEGRVEQFGSPPKPNLKMEAEMYGGRWDEVEPGVWTLTWTKKAIRDFYLNNILMHELGHLIDNRNSGYSDRERYAEWFAVEFGYRRTGGRKARRPEGRVRRRHHA